MLDLVLLFLLLGLAVVGIQQILVGLLGLRGRNLRSALCRLVRGVEVPTGFRDDLLVDRILADPRVDPFGLGAKQSGPVTRVTRIDGGTFRTVLRDVLKTASPDILVEGYAKRPESVRGEIRAEIESLADRVAAHASTCFEPTMAAYADRYKLTMRWMSGLLGIAVVILFTMLLAEPMYSDDWRNVMVALGVFVVPLSAALWYGLLKNVAKLRPEAEVSARVQRASSSSRSPRRKTPKGGPRGGGGEETGESAGKPRAAGQPSGGGQRRRGRRSSSRRSGGRPRSGGGGAGGGGSVGGGGGNG